MNSPKADGIAYPEVYGYNVQDRYPRKGKDVPLDVLMYRALALETSPKISTWLLYQTLSSLKMVSWVFFVRSAEVSCCPVCFEALEIIGSRERTWRKRDGEKNILIIRRLRCTRCKTIHHELPDFLVPYKRYDAQSIELGITQGSQSDVAADESTLNRWRTWFHWIASYWLGCLHALLHSFAQPVERSSKPSQSALHDIGRLLGHEFGWLSRVVQLVVNHHFWVHTRSAFLSALP